MGSARAAVGTDRSTVERELNQLRRVSLLLGVGLVTVLVRVIIDGPTILNTVTAASILALLVASVLLRALGRRLIRSGR